uniref:TTF-type domain-containing protein n=1 Tax=Pygocentrus nattereri TaxID=42514 RepID=A0AAR2LVQ4_PYGNA
DGKKSQEACGTSTHVPEVLDLGNPQTGPKQVQNYQFPHSQIGTQKRAFQQSWFQMFEWLEYSVQKNAAFCFMCRLYSKPKQPRDQRDSLLTTGFTNWKRALDSFREHESSAIHKSSVISWMSFKATEVHGNVTELLQAANVSEIVQRREYLRRVAAVTAFLGKQGIAFRGHKKGEESDNKGNFMECMQLLEEFDPFQSYKPPSCVTYLSPSSQNEMIQKIKAAKMYSIMVDEARDHHSEQLALCVRYVNSQDMVKERFLGFCKLKAFDANTITETIETQLVKHGLEHLTCVAQAHDGASVMRGAVGDVQAHFKEKHPEAIYIHCYAHELNLVLCHTCKAIPEACDLKALKNQLGIGEGELVQLSRTRWSCQIDSINAILKNLPAVIQTLQNISTPLAIGLQSKLCRFATVYMLVMFQKLFSVTEGLHKYLQRESVDLAQAMQFKTAVHDALKNCRCSEKAMEIFDKTKTICSDLGIEEHTKGTQRKQKKIEGYVVESPCGTRSDLSTGDLLRQRVFFPVLDRMLNEIEIRFSGAGAQFITGIQACHPSSEYFLNEESLRHLATHYRISLQPEEVMVAKQFFSRKDKDALPNIQSVFSLLHVDMFPSLKAIFQVALTIPVSSCSCERSFSALCRLHTWLRSTMGQDRLNHLAVKSIEKELLTSMDQGNIINRFAEIKPRRYSLMLPHSKN